MRQGTLGRSRYDCVWAYAEAELGWSRRTAQRHHKLGRALDRFPRLDEAAREGLPPEAAGDIGGFASTPEQCDRLLRLAWHLGPRDLKQALANDGERLGDYERALDFAGRHEEALLGPGGPTTLPSGVTDVVHIGVEGASNAGTGAADAPAPHSDGAAPSAGTPKGRRRIRRRVRLRVSLVWPEPERPHTVQAHPDLLEAARWFVENNPLPRLSGFAACKERARYRCENPECWRLGLDHEAHHIQFCQHGGSDDPDNAVSVCRGCHGRSIHTGDERIRVTRVELQGLRTRLWEYTGRAPILQFLDLPPATPSLRAAA